MNLIILLRGSFGTDCVKTFRRLEKLEKKWAPQKNHLRFKLRFQR